MEGAMIHKSDTLEQLLPAHTAGSKLRVQRNYSPQKMCANTRSPYSWAYMYIFDKPGVIVDV